MPYRSLWRQSRLRRVKQVDMPESMLRAMAKQAEAERETPLQDHPREVSSTPRKSSSTLPPCSRLNL